MKKKGNILIIVVFLMLASSALAMLMTRYVMQLISNASELKNYVSAYYMARGGVESELTKMKNHDFGYQSQIDSGSSINQNFSGHIQNANNYISGQVLGRSQVYANTGDLFGLTNCDQLDPAGYFQLKQGQGFILPLYSDNGEGERFYSTGDSTIVNIEKSDLNNMYLTTSGDYISTSSGALTVLTSGTSIGSASDSVFDSFDIIDTNTKSFQGSKDYKIGDLFDQTKLVLNTANNEKNYLILVSKNEILPGNKPQNYCLTGDKLFPSAYSKIQMQGFYNNRVVNLQVTKKTQLPEYLIYTSTSL